MTKPKEITPFFYGHYYAKIPTRFEDVGQKWIKEVNDFAYPVIARAR